MLTQSRSISPQVDNQIKKTEFLNKLKTASTPEVIRELVEEANNSNAHTWLAEAISDQAIPVTARAITMDIVTEKKYPSQITSGIIKCYENTEDDRGIRKQAAGKLFQRLYGDKNLDELTEEEQKVWSALQESLETEEKI